MIAMMSRRALPLAAAVALALGLAGFGVGYAAAPDAVTIDNFTFLPAMLTVAPGAKVTWTNRDDEPHTVLSADGGATIKSPALDTGDVYSFTFDKPGSYKYFCSLHPHMTGTIVVK